MYCVNGFCITEGTGEVFAITILMLCKYESRLYFLNETSCGCFYLQMNSCYIKLYITVTCLTNGKRLPGNQTYFDDEIIPDSCEYGKVDIKCITQYYMWCGLI